MALSKLVIVFVMAAAPPDPVITVKNAAERAAESVQLGDALLQLGDMKGACRAYEQAVVELPSWWMPHLAIVRCGRFVGLPLDRLIEHAEFAVQARPQIPVAHTQLGLVLEESGQIDRAIAAYETALRRHADLTGARFRLGVLMARQDRLVPARRHLEEVLRARPDYMVARVHLTRVYEKLGLNDQAERGYLALVAKSRYPARALVRLWRFYKNHGMKKRAQEVRKRYKNRYGN